MKLFPLQISTKLFWEAKVNPYILKHTTFHKQSKISRFDAFVEFKTHIYACAWLFECVKFLEEKYKFSR